MKARIVRALLPAVIIGALQFGGCSGKPQVLIYVRDGSSDFEYMLHHELGVMKHLLEEAGLRVVVATDSEESYYHLRAALNPDLSLPDVKVSKYAGFLLRGKHYTLELPRIQEGIYSGTGVVQDGLIITAGICPHRTKLTGRPDGTAELTRKLIEAVQ